MDSNSNKVVVDANQYADRVIVTYYTDPLCCWSWAQEPHWQRLLAEYGDQITYSYFMGGLIPEWQKFNDPINGVERPVQMGPVWMEAKHLTGAQIDESIWVTDPPSSSYPACIAVKAAGLQSTRSEEVYLNRIRVSVMTKTRNIARAEVLAELAKQTSEQFPDIFNLDRFLADVNSEASRQAFRNDLAKTRYERIGRFPSITMGRTGGKTILMTGYRPYHVLEQALKTILAEPANTLSSC